LIADSETGNFDGFSVCAHSEKVGVSLGVIRNQGCNFQEQNGIQIDVLFVHFGGWERRIAIQLHGGASKVPPPSDSAALVLSIFVFGKILFFYYYFF
jgi:hypothetical protein